MKFVALTPECTGLTGFTHKVIIDNTDVFALGGNASGSVQLVPTGSAATLPPGTLVTRAAAALITPFTFSDGTMNSLLVDVGDGGDNARFLAGMQVAALGANVAYAAQVIAKSPYVYLVADGIDIKFTCAGGAGPLLNKCTAGKAEVYLAICGLADFKIAR